MPSPLLPAARRSAPSHWSVSAVVAGVVMLLMVGLFRVPRSTGSSPTRFAAKPTINVRPSRSDELALRDLTPLFLPTSHNARPVRAPQLEPGKSQFDIDPVVHLQFDVNDPAVLNHVPVPVQPPARPVDAVTDQPGSFSMGYGRAVLALEPPVASGGHVDVYGGAGARAAGQALVLRVGLPPDVRPRVGAGQSWQPLEFIGAVDSAGLVGPLTLASGSGVEEIDSYFRNYLAGPFRMGDRLPPGFYRIVVGP